MIDLKFVVQYGELFGQITEQTSRHTFLASNNVQISSCVEPEIVIGDNLHFYTRGEDTSRDRALFKVPKKWAFQLTQAVDEYNKYAERLRTVYVEEYIHTPEEETWL